MLGGNSSSPVLGELAVPPPVLPSLVVIAVWLSGNLIVIFLAGLQNVPRIYYEAAEIDGANGWQRFCHITVPTMTPIIFFFSGRRKV